MIRIQLLLISIFSLFFLVLSPIGISQNINSPNDYPLRPVKLVIPYVAGGGIDSWKNYLPKNVYGIKSKLFY